MISDEENIDGRNLQVDKVYYVEAYVDDEKYFISGFIFVYNNIYPEIVGKCLLKQNNKLYELDYWMCHDDTKHRLATEKEIKLLKSKML